MEDFFGEKAETIMVSTIHKAKGREFDNVFLMLDQFNAEKDEAIRQLYVAMTRAKCSLIIHYNGNYLDAIKAEDLKRVDVEEAYSPPCQSAMQLTFKDVWLDDFTNYQHWISQLNAGDELTIDQEGCCNLKGHRVLRFSKECKNKIETMKQNNYLPKTAKIRFIVYWKNKENGEKEIRIILPDLNFERIT